MFTLMAMACLPISATVPTVGSPVIQATEVAKLILSDGKYNDEFGRAVAIHGDRLVVSSLERSAPGPNTRRGAAYVYVRTSTGWDLEQRLTAFDSAKFDFFGEAVAFDGTTVLVGAHMKDTVNGSDSGAAYTFVRSPTGWVSQGKLLPSEGTPDGIFGDDLDIDGDTLIVGAPWEASDGFTRRGAAYVYVRRDGVWLEQAKLVGEELAFLVFGADVAIRGDQAFVSTPTAARVYAFERSGTTWTHTTVLQPESPPAGYGEKIDFDGQTLWVGAAFDPTGGLSAGSVFSYVRENGTWTFEQHILSANPFPSQFFGQRVEVEGDWGIASEFTPSSGFKKGVVHVLHRRDGVWSEVGSFCASDDFPGLDFGWSIGFDGATVVSGAMEGLGISQMTMGAAYVHVLDLPPLAHCATQAHSEGCEATITWTGQASLTDPTPFPVDAQNVVTDQSGVLLYGLSGPADLPFDGGTLCVAPPLKRTPIQDSGGQAGAPCSGTFTFDVNAWLQAGHVPAAAPGVRIDGQYWFRDPDAPAHFGLTNALRFFVNP